MSKRSKTLTRNIEGKVTAAINKYSMINPGDKIAAAVSGGKDSVFLLYTLAKLKQYFKTEFELTAVTLDSRFGNEEMPLEPIKKLCDNLNIKYEIKNTELGKLIFEDRKEKNPCSLCSRMRKGILNNTAKELGCNKIALGHNYDDVVQTFLMNLLSCGKIGCFSPVSYLSRKDIFMIRPLIFCREHEIIKAVKKYELPIVKSKCPVDRDTNRSDTENLICFLEKKYPDIRSKIMGAMQRKNIDGWGI